MHFSSNPVESRTFCELLRARTEQHGDRRACTFLTDGEQAEATFTYAELDRRARQIGAWLQHNGSAGKPVLLVYPQGLDFIAAFFGCLYAGAYAIPAYPPRRNRRATRICCMVSDAAVEVALSTDEILGQMADLLQSDPVLSRPRWQSTDGLHPQLADDWTEPAATPDSLAFLQYTSGSIGDPKGVMVSHANLLENQRLICHSFRQDEGIVVVGWLPLHHDMGLIGNMLHPLYLGGQFVFMAPVAFLQQPIRWLKAISKYRATITGGPNFAFELCVSGTTFEQRQGLDLSSLSVAFTGAERVQDTTLREFEKAFAPYGFSRNVFCPCYGLAETTLITSGIIRQEPVVVTRLDPLALAREDVVPLELSRDGETCGAPSTTSSNSKPIDLVSCGIPAPSVELRIVDPETLTECGPGRVGEIWVAGATVAQGYWGKPELTRETFQATLAAQADDPTAQHYLRTGDFGFLHHGHIHIAGRLKDLIIVRGGNHYPSDIEQTASTSHASLIVGSCAAFSVDVEGEEQVALVQEVQRSQLRSIDSREVCEAIRLAVVDDHLVPLHAILLVRPGSIPKTTSGKVQRREARRMFENDEFKVAARWVSTDETGDVSLGTEPSSGDLETGRPEQTIARTVSVQQQEEIDALEQWVLERLSHHLGIAPTSIDVRQPFARYGVDSLKAVRMTGELEEHLGRSIAPTLLFDYPNLSALVRYLVMGETRDTQATFVAPRVDEPIAVVGLGCRFPGSDSPAAFWNLLAQGRHAIGPVPFDRWGAALQQLSDAASTARHRVECGGFVEHIDQFDAGLFGINAREAEETDPQQRLLLHVAWEAFENAGISLDSLAGSRTGVFVGVSGNEYGHLQTASQHGPNIYRATGNSLAVIANRLSFLFDFRGPSWAVDTACSSSLVAVHQACVSLRRGECNLAVTSGISLIVSPTATASLNQAGMLSPTGRCHAFSSSADGFVRGEGCGVLLLKRLSDAQADGDRIVCLLRGSAVNQDGRSNGLTAPNGLAQQAVIRSALSDAQLEAQDIDYLEAHGTGTALGDPIEMGAVRAVFAPARAADRPLQVGSVKTNLGHLEGAAGIAGLLKVCLALQHGAIPPHLHFQQPSPHIDWNWPLQIPTRLTPWLSERRPRRAGVSSFGFGGTNAHVVVEEAPASSTPAPPAAQNAAPALLVLSAKTPTALRAQARQFADVARDVPLSDLCYTAAVGRAHFPHRLAVPARDPAQVQQALQQFAQGGAAPQLQHAQTRRESHVAFVFGGQGPQALGAGRGLYEHDRTFRHLLDEVCEMASGYWPRDLRSVLWQDAALWEQVDIQPALFGLQLSLARLWDHYGVTPSVLLGHSLGEYAAACMAGVFSPEDALRLVTARARLVGQLETSGRMLVVLAPHETVRALLAESVDIAAINGPRQTVVAGAADAVQGLQTQLDAHQIRYQRLATTHAFHSALVEPILSAFGEVAQQVSYAPPQRRLISSMLGTRATTEVAQPAYWQQHLRRTVCFHQAATCLLADKPAAVMEIGAGSTAVGLIRSVFRGSDPSLLKGLSGGPSEWTEHLQRLGQLYLLGAGIQWPAVWSQGGRKVALPTYPFETRRYWFTAAAAAATTTPLAAADMAGDGEGVHPLLGRRLDLAGQEIVYETQLLCHSFLRDHRIGEQVVFPATGYLELALAAGQDAGFKLLDVWELKIRRPLELDAAVPPRVQVVLAPQDDGFACRILCRQADRAWRLHATCSLRATGIGAEEENTSANVEPAGPPPADFDSATAVAEHYARCGQLGLHYGPAFQGLCRLHPGDGQAWGQVRLPRGVDHDGYLLHPALLDACLQVTAGALREEQAAAWLPVKVQTYRVTATDACETELSVHVRCTSSDADSQKLIVDITGATPDGRPSFYITGLEFQRVALRNIEELAFHDHWVPQLRRREQTPVIPSLSASDVGGHLEACRGKIAAQTGLAQHTNVLDSLETLSGQIVFHVLRQNFRPLEQKTPFTTEEAANALGVTSEHTRLFQRLIQILQEDRYLERRDDRWIATGAECEQQPFVRVQQMIIQHPAAEPELTLLGRCGGQLLSVLRGETDPLTLLFPSDGSISAGNLYRDSIGGQAMNTLIAEALARIAGDLPDGRGLRVLEIGAGTGSTTESVVQRISDQRVHYVFTDIAASFLPAARKRFSAYSNMQFRTLDIQRDPLTQGLQAADFDVIVAANVIHATADMHVALRHIHNLLAPGGKLIVLEGTRPVRWLDLTFGLTNGWWRFTDTQLRPDYPLLPADRWQRLLAATGFAAPQVVAPLPTTVGQREPENSVIVAQRSTPVGETLDAPRRAEHAHHWLILADQMGVGEHLADQLKTRDATCQLVPAPPRDDAGNNQLPASLLYDRVPTDVVFLWSLDEVDERRSPAERAEELNVALLNTVQTVARQRSQVVAADTRHGPQPLRFWVVTRGAQGDSDGHPMSAAQASLWGFVRTLALEHPDWHSHLVDLDPAVDSRRAAATLLDEVTRDAGENENEIVFRSGRRLVRRMQRSSPRDATARDNLSTHLRIGARGTVDGLELVQQQRETPGPGQIEVAVHASGLNFRDVLNVLGQYPGEPPLGAECSGIITRVGESVERFSMGDRVVVVAPDTFRDFLVVDQNLVAAVPDSLSLDEAATLPIAYLTASVALEELGRLEAGNRVLIHAATGGVGFAAIQLALAAGAEIFATASVGKHAALRAMGIENVFDSRATGFAAEILKATSGQGVDLVLNSLGPEFIEENVRALAANGTYLDITKAQAVNESPAFASRTDLRYHSLDLAQLLHDQPQLIQSKLAPLVQRVVAGQLQPLPFRGFDLLEAKAAFRFMRAARHIGKILLHPARQQVPAATTLPRREVRDRTTPTVRKDRSYVITGGLGGLGLAVARSLAQQGAGHIGLLARRQPNDQEQSVIREITATGAMVTALPADVENPDEVTAALDSLRETALPLGGVFHLAGRLDDGLILRQSAQQFANVLGPKAHGAWHLHQATLGDELQHFVLFSSVSSVLGSTGQANHAAANAFLDGLADYRQARGLPALTINWGPWSEIGAAAQRDVGSRSDLTGIDMISPAEGIALLDAALRNGATQTAALRLNIDQLPTRWRERPLFDALHRPSGAAQLDARHDSEFLCGYRQASEDQRRGLLLAHLQSLVARTLGIDSPKSVAVDQALSDMGLDSLASLELGNHLEESLSVSIPSTLVYDYPTLENMADYFIGHLPTTEQSAGGTSRDSDAQAPLAALHQEETGPAATELLCRVEPAESQTAPDTTSDDVLQSILELSDELDRWDEV